MAASTKTSTGPKVTVSNYRLDTGDSMRIGTFSINVELVPDGEDGAGMLSLNFCSLVRGVNDEFWIAGPSTLGKRHQNVRLGWIGKEVQAKLLPSVIAKFQALKETAPVDEEVLF